MSPVLIKIQTNIFLPNSFMQLFLHSLALDYLYFFGMSRIAYALFSSYK
jgi:hypothetical protein